MNSKIVVIGSLNTDLVTVVRKRPAVGETILGKEFFTTPGGKGANQAFAAATLGGDVRLIGKVGGDYYGEKLLSQLEKSNVKVDSIFIDKNSVSGTASITIDENGDNTIIVVPGANNNLTPKEVGIFKKEIKNAELIVLQLEIPLETVIESIEIAASKNIPILLDPSPVPEKGLPSHLLSKISYITPNLTELALLSGIKTIDYKSVVAASNVLLNKGVKCVFAKLAENGVVVSTESETFHIPGFQVEAIDTTAAGDTFIGALAASITKGLSIKECVRMANAAAALAVTKYGAQQSVPSLKETINLLEKGEEIS